MPSPVQRLRSALEGEYAFERELGSGGLGVLWLARDRADGRQVVLKTLREDRQSPASSARFLREARLLARVDHPSVVRVLRSGEAAGIPYCVMEFLDGPDLARRLDRGPLGHRDFDRLVSQLLGGLAAVHAAGIVHRDVKPANIVWLAGRAVLVDFGLARAPDEPDGGVTATGAAVGTPGYLAPEQAGNPDVGPPADIYSAAAVLYEAATGRRWSGSPNPRGADWTGVPRGMRGVLAKALAWSPARRWPDAGSFRQALHRASVRRRAGRLALASLPLAALALAVLVPGATSHEGPAADLEVGPFEGCAGDDSAAGKLRGYVLHHLDWYSDWRVVADARIANWRLAGETNCLPGSAVTITIRDSAGAIAHEFTGAGPELLETARAIADSVVATLWPEDLADWRNIGGPGRHPAEATSRYFEGEEAFQRDDWVAAEARYLEALRLDPTFALARWRLMLVRQWRRVPFQEDAAHLLREPGDLPPLLLELVRIGEVPDVRERIARYERAALVHPRDSHAALAYANEVFVRGPLVGIPLDTGLILMRHVEALDPTRNLAPALDHQAWGAIRLGDRATAWRAVQRRARLHDAGGLGPFFELAYWERFHPKVAPVIRWWSFRRTSVPDLRLIAKVHRLAITFDLPDAQAALAELVLARTDATPIRATAFEGLAIARLATGRAVSAFAAFDSAAMLFEGGDDSRAGEWCVAATALEFPLVSPAEASQCEAALGGTAREHRRAWARWALAALGAGARGDTIAMTRWLARYDSLPLEEDTRRWRALLEAERLALSGEWSQALARSEAAVAYDSAGKLGGTFLRSAAHLRRARWWERLGEKARAEAELVWYQNTDVRGWLDGRAQAGEADAVFSGVARLELARLALERGDESRCGLVRRVGQLWRDADAAAALRARLGPLEARCRDRRAG